VFRDHERCGSLVGCNFYRCANPFTQGPQSAKGRMHGLTRLQVVVRCVFRVGGIRAGARASTMGWRASDYAVIDLNPGRVRNGPHAAARLLAGKPSGFSVIVWAVK